MWADLGSPPDNFRFYKFSEEQTEQCPPVPPEQFKGQKPSKVQSNHQLKKHEHVTKKVFGQKESNSIRNSGTTPQLSTQKKDKSQFDLRTDSRKNTGSNFTNGLSALNGCSQKSEKMLSKNSRNQKSRLSSKLFVPSSLTLKSQRPKNCLKDLNNQQQLDESFSQIFLNEINKTENHKRSAQFDNSKYIYDMIVTLKEIRDVQKQNLIHNKKVYKILKETTHHNDFKQGKTKKFRKSVKRDSKKSSIKKDKQKSTVKKNQNLVIEDRMCKIEEKLKFIQKIVSEESQLKKNNPTTRKMKSHSLMR